MPASRAGWIYRVQDLGPEVGELGRLVGRDLGDHLRPRLDPRVDGGHAGRLGPDLDLLRPQHRAEDRRRAVRPSAPKGRGDALEGRAHVAAEDRHHPRVQHGLEVEARPLPRLVHEGLGRAERLVGDEHGAGVDRLRAQALVG
jgi:hypothetical protein